MKLTIVSVMALCSTIIVCFADGPMVDLRGVTNANQIIGFLGIPLGASAVVTGTVQLDPPHPKERQKGETFENLSNRHNQWHETGCANHP